MKFTTVGYAAITKHDLCDWEVSFKASKGSKVEHVQTVYVTASEVDAWDLARGKLEGMGYTVGFSVAIKWLGRWI